MNEWITKNKNYIETDLVVCFFAGSTFFDPFFFSFSSYVFEEKELKDWYLNV